MSLSVQKTVFVYGSFTKGLIHNTKIEQYIEVREKAYVYGHAYLLNVGYPTLVLDGPKLKSKPAQKIYGEMLTLCAPDLVHRILDDFHGVSLSVPEKGLYFKSQAMVYTQDNSLESIIYHLNPKKLCKSSAYIAGGNWQEAFERAPRPQDLLTEGQIEYMKHLSSIKGRQTHRYNLDLCRQLMKLEMVVDKGRRFSLTRLGKDVLRYLP